MFVSNVEMVMGSGKSRFLMGDMSILNVTSLPSVRPERILRDCDWELTADAVALPFK